MSRNDVAEVDIELERLHWRVDVDGRDHVIDLIPGVLGSVVVEVDGATVAHVPRPAPQRPWHETRFDLDGTSVDVAVIWHRPVIHTDVFVGGRSIRDRRTLEQARDAAPRPATNYDTWIGGVFRYRVPPRPAILTRGMGIAAAISLVALAVVFTWTSRPSGPIAGLVVGVAMVSLFLIWFATWTAVTTRVHLALLARPELGDQGRVAWFTVALLGYPVLSLAVVVLMYGVARSLASG
jgi:hypothetical protein